MLTDKELKLVRLALDPGATDGEWNNAAVAFFRCARARSASAIEFEHNGTALIVPPMPPDYGLTIFPWGQKHRGELFKDISPTYLQWAQGWMKEHPDMLIRYKGLYEAIEAFLKQ